MSKPPPPLAEDPFGAGVSTYSETHHKWWATLPDRCGTGLDAATGRTGDDTISEPSLRLGYTREVDFAAWCDDTRTRCSPPAEGGYATARALSIMPLLRSPFVRILCARRDGGWKTVAWEFDANDSKTRIYPQRER